MKVIIPMAGMGKRMRPHTLSVPKPLIPIAGKPIVQRLVEELTRISPEDITEIAFIIGDFGKEVEQRLKLIANTLGAEAKIYYQYEPLGTAHAVYCARKALEGKIIVAFADTLFKADFVFDTDADGIVWVKKLKDPSSFGVVSLDSNNIISNFVEHPTKFISDLAIIGIYYFRDASKLETELKLLIDNKRIVNNEYQITVALENLKNKGLNFIAGNVDQWLDCGNKNATINTNMNILDDLNGSKLVSDSSQIIDSVILKPSYVGENVIIENSVVGPYISIGKNSRITNSIIQNSIIQTNSNIVNLNVKNSMVGNYVDLIGDISEVNIGDYTMIYK
jgi:glucose-1-phosphate thymidylyltransferase